MSQEKNILKVNGMMKSPGDLNCDAVKVDGMLKIDGSLKTEDLNGDGMVTIKGDAHVGSIDMDGMIKLKGALEAKKVIIDGMIKAQSINSDEIEISGKVEADDINCDVFSLDLNGGKSAIANIEGSSVKVTNHRVIRKSYLRVNTITADDIDIEYVECDTISGDHVKIGKGCKVEHVTYLSSLEIDPKASVKKNEKAE